MGGKLSKVFSHRMRSSGDQRRKRSGRVSHLLTRRRNRVDPAWFSVEPSGMNEAYEVCSYYLRLSEQISAAWRNTARSNDIAPFPRPIGCSSELPANERARDNNGAWASVSNPGTTVTAPTNGYPADMDFFLPGQVSDPLLVQTGEDNTSWQDESHSICCMAPTTITRPPQPQHSDLQVGDSTTSSTSALSAQTMVVSRTRQKHTAQVKVVLENIEEITKLTGEIINYRQTARSGKTSRTPLTGDHGDVSKLVVSKTEPKTPKMNQTKEMLSQTVRRRTRDQCVQTVSDASTQTDVTETTGRREQCVQTASSMSVVNVVRQRYVTSSAPASYCRRPSFKDASSQTEVREMRNCRATWHAPETPLPSTSSLIRSGDFVNHLAIELSQLTKSVTAIKEGSEGIAYDFFEPGQHLKKRKSHLPSDELRRRKEERAEELRNKFARKPQQATNESPVPCFSARPLNPYTTPLNTKSMSAIDSGMVVIKSTSAGVALDFFEPDQKLKKMDECPSTSALPRDTADTKVMKTCTRGLVLDLVEPDLKLKKMDECPPTSDLLSDTADTAVMKTSSRGIDLGLIDPDQRVKRIGPHPHSPTAPNMSVVKTTSGGVAIDFFAPAEEIKRGYYHPPSDDNNTDKPSKNTWMPPSNTLPDTNSGFTQEHNKMPSETKHTSTVVDKQKPKATRETSNGADDPIDNTKSTFTSEHSQMATANQSKSIPLAGSGGKIEMLPADEKLPVVMAETNAKTHQKQNKMHASAESSTANPNKLPDLQGPGQFELGKATCRGALGRSSTHAGQRTCRISDWEEYSGGARPHSVMYMEEDFEYGDLTRVRCRKCADAFMMPRDLLTVCIQQGATPLTQDRAGLRGSQDQRRGVHPGREGTCHTLKKTSHLLQSLSKQLREEQTRIEKNILNKPASLLPKMRVLPPVLDQPQPPIRAASHGTKELVEAGLQRGQHTHMPKRTTSQLLQNMSAHLRHEQAQIKHKLENPSPLPKYLTLLPIADQADLRPPKTPNGAKPETTVSPPADKKSLISNLVPLAPIEPHSARRSGKQSPPRNAICTVLSSESLKHRGTPSRITLEYIRSLHATAWIGGVTCKIGRGGVMFTLTLSTSRAELRNSRVPETIKTLAERTLRNPQEIKQEKAIKERVFQQKMQELKLARQAYNYDFNTHCRVVTKRRDDLLYEKKFIAKLYIDCKQDKARDNKESLRKQRAMKFEAAREKRMAVREAKRKLTEKRRGGNGASNGNQDEDDNDDGDGHGNQDEDDNDDGDGHGNQDGDDNDDGDGHGNQDEDDNDDGDGHGNQDEDDNDDGDGHGNQDEDDNDDGDGHGNQDDNDDGDGRGRGGGSKGHGRRDDHHDDGGDGGQNKDGQNKRNDKEDYKGSKGSHEKSSSSTTSSPENGADCTTALIGDGRSNEDENEYKTNSPNHHSTEGRISTSSEDQQNLGDEGTEDRYSHKYDSDNTSLLSSALQLHHSCTMASEDSFDNITDSSPEYPTSSEGTTYYSSSNEEYSTHATSDESDDNIDNQSNITLIAHNDGDFESGREDLSSQHSVHGERPLFHVSSGEEEVVEAQGDFYDEADGTPIQTGDEWDDDAENNEEMEEVESDDVDAVDEYWQLQNIGGRRYRMLYSM